MADQEVLSISIDPGDSSAKALELKKRLEELGKESEDLAKSFKSGAVGIVEHIANQEALAKKVAATTAAYEKQVAAIQKAATQTVSVNTTMGGASAGGGRDFAAASRNIGNLMQDAQYGVSAVTNNIVQWAPALGVALVALDAFSKSSGTIADGLGRWAESIKDSNKELSESLTIAEAFVRQVNWEKSGNWWSALAGNVAAGNAGRAINPGDVATAKREAAEAEAGRAGLGGILGQDQKDRQKALRDTIEQAGGGDAFGAALFQGLGKEARDVMARQLNKALSSGDINAFLGIQSQLAKNGQGQLSSQMDANMPEFREEVKRQQKKLDGAAKLQEEQIKRKAAQDKADLKEANDRAKDTNDLLDKEERENKQKMQGQAKDALDEIEGLRGNASLTYARYLANGDSPESAAKGIAASIEQELVARGIEGGVAKEQAGDYARGIRRDVGNRISQAGMMANHEVLNKPSVFGLTDANRLAQEAGPKIQEEQRDLLKQTVEHLAGIRGSGFPAVVGP
jgi:hypothetical protein